MRINHISTKEEIKGGKRWEAAIGRADGEWAGFSPDATVLTHNQNDG